MTVATGGFGSTCWVAFWSQNISKKTVKWLIGAWRSADILLFAQGKHWMWNIVWLRPSVEWHAVYVEVLWLCWCSVHLLFQQARKMWPHLPCLFTLKMVNTMYGETAEHLWHTAWLKLSKVELTHSVESAESMRTWTRCSAEPPKHPWKVLLLHCISVGPPRILCSIYVCSFIFIQCRCFLFNLWRWLLCTLDVAIQFAPLRRAWAVTILNTKLSVVCRDLNWYWV